MNGVLKGLRASLAAVVLAAVVQAGAITLSPLADAANTAMAATTNVNIRKGPGTDTAKVGLLRKGEKITAIGTSGGWTKVEWKGGIAWVASAYLTGSSTDAPATSTPSASGGTAFTTANLNLRKGPSLSDAVVAIATKGTKLSLTGTVSGAYTQVLYNGQKLWASNSYLASRPGAPTQSLPAVAYKVRATAALMIRTASGAKFTSLGDVPRGTILDATGVVQGGTAQVIWQGNLRWVNNSYVTKVTASAPSAPTTPGTTKQYATANLNVWHAATGDAYTGMISRGSVVNVTGKVASGRAEVVHNGLVRWVTAKYLSATAPAPSAPSGSPGAGAPSGDINKGWSSGLEKTNPSVQTIAWYVWNNYPQIKTQYGWRRDVTPDHPAGRAVDVMIPSYKSNQALGWEIANFFRANAKQFNINYVIFGQKIWSVQRNSEGWRSMASRGNDTANHYDHVHINTYGG